MISTDEPVVSICISAYNGARLISRALESCINQTYRKIEIVVTDDGNDDTEIIVKEYAKRDSRIKYLKNEERLGAADNFLKSYKAASGYFIQHLDQDEWLDLNYVKEKVSIFKKHPDVAFVAGNILSYRLDSSGNPQLVYETKKREGFYDSEYIFNNFYRRHGEGLIGHFCMVRRLDLLENFMSSIPNSYGYDEYYKKAKVIDALPLLCILRNYKQMYYTTRTSCNGLFHSANASSNFGLEASTINDHVKSGHVDLVGFGYFYKKYAPSLFYRFRVFMGANIVVTVLLDKITKRASGSIFDSLYIFFQDYSFKERLGVVFAFPLRFLMRSLEWQGKLLRNSFFKVRNGIKC